MARQFNGTRQLEQYLGDGVYAVYDGYHVVLELRAQIKRSEFRIALEPTVIGALVAFQRRAIEESRTQENADAKTLPEAQPDQDGDGH